MIPFGYLLSHLEIQNGQHQSKNRYLPKFQNSRFCSSRVSDLLYYHHLNSSGFQSNLTSTQQCSLPAGMSVLSRLLLQSANMGQQWSPLALCWLLDHGYFQFISHWLQKRDKSWGRMWAQSSVFLKLAHVSVLVGLRLRSLDQQQTHLLGACSTRVLLQNNINSHSEEWTQDYSCGSQASRNTCEASVPLLSCTPGQPSRHG